jgi:putative transposase
LARVAREKSSTGIYHIMLRGINRQTIFEDNQDRMRFIDTLAEYKEICNYRLFGYCLMDNHIHLLIQETDKTISDIIKRISASYVYWYNTKYDRCGHLFQDRFKSEVVENFEYFMTVLRYIHQNPVKANLAKTVDEYRWTSYKEYIKKSGLVNVDLALNYFSNDPSKAKVLLMEFMNKDNEDQCLDIVVKIKLTDEEVREHIRKLGISNPSMFQIMDKDKRDHILNKLKSIEGITIRQLSRVTGLSRSIINRA